MARPEDIHKKYDLFPVSNIISDSAPDRFYFRHYKASHEEPFSNNFNETF